MQKIITFNKVGYDPFLDFIKAYAILAVLLGHTFPFLDETGYSLWYGMQVPLFILVQVFHVLKKENYKLNLNQLFKRVFVPFIAVQLVIFTAFIIKDGFSKNLLVNYAIGGGKGPGSYYPWLYAQLAIILPFVKPIFDKESKFKLAIVSIVVCESLEIISSLIGLPDSIHRLLAVRYLFLIYLGWLWVKEGVVLNAKTLLLSLVSMGAIIYFEYFYTPCEPWFYDTAWKTHRWPCYFYVSTLLCAILYWIYDNTKQLEIVVKSTKLLAKCSYEIFLIQMVMVPFLPQMGFIQNGALRFGVRFTTIWAFSIIGGYYFNIIYGKLIKKIK